MVSKVVMPKLGATMEKGTIVKWLAPVGDYVESGDPIAEIQTDKITLEIEAEASGVLLKTLYDEGSEVTVQEVIAYIGQEDEKIIEKCEDHITEETTIEGNLFFKDKIRRTPAARKLARIYQINLENVPGTGRMGMIKKSDVENYLANNKKTSPLSDTVHLKEPHLVSSPGPDQSGNKPIPISAEVVDDQRMKLTGIRKVVADRMTQSMQIPQVTLMSEVDMTNCVELRKNLLPIIEKTNGFRLSYNDILIKIVAHTIRRYPTLNASLQNDEIVCHSSVNIGFAVDTPAGLVVPVVKNAQKLGLVSITETCNQLIRLAREGNLKYEQMREGTLTISNLGKYEIDEFTPIINPPEAAILGVGRIRPKPVVINEEIKIKSTMKLSLTFDHRIVDGAPAAAFLSALKETLECPYQLFM
ncbi:dihydrolipoamide acetyltransferase family protein [Sporolactobacillus sp. Y61]|uniref:Dihydrolipoamide acetyltransferase component of pyruvate dehydrogenase complex n=1 Tax=Sporolactobacillus sp. Y61 TaxID=3160863 RepID=A0AAU8IEQ4_9BACL